MRRLRWTHVITLAAAIALVAPAAADAQSGRARGQGPIGNPGWENASQHAYERGVREGLQYGEDDGRHGRAFGFDIHVGYRDGDRGYQPRYGERHAYRVSFRLGFESGYRDGYGRVRIERNTRGNRGNRRDDRGFNPRGPRGQEGAYARGYADGYEHGFDDGRDRDRYDPVRHGDYRDADDGYDGRYGSKDAYRNNYRAGFRPGYEEGYRDGQRRRR